MTVSDLHLKSLILAAVLRTGCRRRELQQATNEETAVNTGQDHRGLGSTGGAGRTWDVC